MFSVAVAGADAQQSARRSAVVPFLGVHAYATGIGVTVDPRTVIAGIAVVDTHRRVEWNVVDLAFSRFGGLAAGSALALRMSGDTAEAASLAMGFGARFNENGTEPYITIIGAQGAWAHRGLRIQARLEQHLRATARQVLVTIGFRTR